MTTPNMITTTKGLMDANTLRKETGGVDNDVERTTWVEYWLGEELVHRSVDMYLKQAVEAFPVAESM